MSGDEYEFDVDDLPTDEDEEDVPDEAKIKSGESRESPGRKDWATFIGLSLLTLVIFAVPLGIYYYAGFELTVVTVLTLVWITCIQMIQ